MLRQYFTALILGFVLLTSANCRKQPDQQIDLSQLENKLFLHSYEEDSAEVTTYRSEDFDFPPSRGRKGFKILPDNLFILYAIAPTDGWQRHQGKWNLSENKFVVVDFDDKSLPSKKWEVIKVETNLIKVKEIQVKD